MGLIRQASFALVLWSAAGSLLAVEPSPDPTIPALVTPEPLYAAPASADRSGRILADVEVNGRGPYRFIIDTGANRSALSPRLLRQLDLQLLTGESRRLHGVTGSATLPWVKVDSLRVGEIVLAPGPMPVLNGSVFADAEGILGVEGLQDSRIVVDFDAGRVEITPSAGQRMPRGYLRVRVRLERGGLLMTDGKVGRLPVQVIIDTGAEHTLGNAALRDALAKQIGQRGSRVENTIFGATPDTAPGIAFQVPTVQVGDVRLRNLPVTFGDLHVFSVWGLDSQPALLVGMDILGSLRQLVIDYKLQELHLRTRGTPIYGTAVRRCAPYQCATRIPPPVGD